MTLIHEDEIQTSPTEQPDLWGNVKHFPKEVVKVKYFPMTQYIPQ